MEVFEFYWFVKYLEMVVRCKGYDGRLMRSSLKCKYTPVPHYRQVGPQCGLAALAMIMMKPTKENVDDLFETAKKAKFTNHGEMLSAKNMCQLASEKLTDYRVELFQGYLDCQFIKDFLRSGGFMLVPYDGCRWTGFAMSRGRSAHWAAVTGCFEADCGDSPMFFIMTREGTYDRVGVWPLGALAASNAQLEDISEAHKRDGLEYILPEGGIGGPNGLKLQTVLLYPKHSNL